MRAPTRALRLPRRRRWHPRATCAARRRAGVTWHGSGTKAALATDALLFVLNVRPAYLWAACHDTLVYTYDVPGASEQRIMFWNTRTDERSLKMSAAVVGLAAHGPHCLLSTASDHLGKHDAVVCNTLGSPLDSRALPFEPAFMRVNATHAVLCSADLVYVWQFISPDVRAGRARVPGRVIAHQARP